MKLKLTTLTPLHIGNGQKWYPFEYWQEKNSIWVGDFDRFSDYLLSKDDWEKSYTQLIGFIKSSIKNNRIESSFWDILEKFGLADTTKITELKMAKKSLNYNPSFKNLKKEIDQFVCHPNNSLFIPGSSIKGALRTVFLYNLVQKSLDIRGVYNKDNAETDKLRHIYKYNDAENIHVADIEMGRFKSKVDVVKRIGMSAKGMPRDKQEGNLNAVEVIDIAEEDLVYVNIRSKLSFSQIKKAADDFYLKSLGEIMEIESVKNDNALFVCLSDIQSEIVKESNSIFLQLGKYGDYFTKSLGSLIKNRAVDSRIDDKNLTNLRRVYNFGKIPRLNKYGKIFPKTFSVSSENKPFGWVKLTFEEQ